jgi:hypothetical protein
LRNDVGLIKDANDAWVKQEGDLTLDGTDCKRQGREQSEAQLMDARAKNNKLREGVHIIRENRMVKNHRGVSIETRN